MNGKTRKFRKSAQNYEQAIEKQLHSDFEVHEYLDENKLQGGNIDLYIKLYNSLLVEKDDKRNRLESLEVNCQKINEGFQQQKFISCEVESWGGAKETFIQEYTLIQNYTSNEVEVKNNLLKEIIQTKKSLNLLKGDIGHLVSRNESAKLLSSKIAKVKIVADDQLKRVTLAYSKDKEEIKLRNEMQRKFNKKLKNVSSYEDGSLNRMKRIYIDNVQRKKEIFDKLGYIEKLGLSIEEYGDLEKQKNQKNKNILLMYYELVRLEKIVNKFGKMDADQEREKCRAEARTGNRSEDRSGNRSSESRLQVKDLVHSIFQEERNLKEIYKFEQMLGSSTGKTHSSRSNQQISSSELEIINSGSLGSIEQAVFSEYHRLKSLIKKNTQSYNEGIKKKEELTLHWEKCVAEEEELQHKFHLQLQEGYKINEQNLIDYSEKFKKFTQVLKAYFCLLEFMEKSVHYSSERRSLEEVVSFSKKLSEDASRQSVDLEECRQPTALNSNYISQLHFIYNALLQNYEGRDKSADMREEEVAELTKLIYNELEKDIKRWLHAIKIKIVNYDNNLYQLYEKRLKNFKPTSSLYSSTEAGEPRISKGSHFKKDSILIEEEEHEIREEEKYLNQSKGYHSIHSDEPSQKQKNAMLHGAYTRLKSSNPKTNLSSTPLEQDTKAQRIKLLEDIDQDYYKMLKSTIIMEKENTRKNYQFLRTFKRGKYSSRDDILEEKRFEASFSVLFTNASQKNPDKTNKHANNLSPLSPKNSRIYKSSQGFRQHARKERETLQQIAQKHFQNQKEQRELKLAQCNESMKKIGIKKNINTMNMKGKHFKQQPTRKSRLASKVKEVLSFL